MSTKSKEKQVLIQKYERIPPTDFHGLIYFFERYENALCQLDPGIYTSMHSEYLESLAKAGHYHKYLVRVDVEIQNELNQEAFNREAYISLLYKKAYAAYYTLEWDQSINILENILSLAPDHKQAKKLYVRAQRKKDKAKYKWIYGLSIILLLGMSAVLLVEILVFEAFAQEFAEKTLRFRNALLVTCLSLLGGFELITYLLALRRLRQVQS